MFFVWKSRWRRRLSNDTDTLILRIPISRQLLVDGEVENVAAIVQATAGETARTAVLNRIFAIRKGSA
jgi:hypothetical protein